MSDCGCNECLCKKCEKQAMNNDECMGCYLCAEHNTYSLVKKCSRFKEEVNEKCSL